MHHLATNDSECQNNPRGREREMTGTATGKPHSPLSRGPCRVWSRCLLSRPWVLCRWHWAQPRGAPAH